MSFDPYFAYMYRSHIVLATLLFVRTLQGQTDSTETTHSMPEVVQCRADWWLHDSIRYELTRTNLKYSGDELTSRNSYRTQVLITVEDSGATGYRLKWHRFADIPAMDENELPESYRESYRKLRALDIQLLTDTSGTLLQIVDREAVIDRWVEMMRAFLPTYKAELSEDERARFTGVEDHIWEFRELLSKELIEEIQLFFAPFGLYLNTQRSYTQAVSLPNTFTNKIFPATGTYGIGFNEDGSYRIEVDVAVDKVLYQKEVHKAIRAMQARIPGSERIRKKDMPPMDMGTTIRYVLDSDRSWIRDMRYEHTVYSAESRVVQQVDLSTTLAVPEPNTLMSWDARIEAAPDDPMAYVGRAHLHADQGDHLAAIEDYTMALTLDSTLHAVYDQRAYSWRQVDRNKEAHADLETAVRLAPEEIRYQVSQAEMLIEERKYEEAGDRLKALVAKDPGSSSAWLSLGMVHRQLYRYAESIAAFDEAVRLRPKDAAALAHRASARKGMRTAEQDSLARLDLEASLAIEPENQAVLATIGNDLLASSKPDEAIPYFDRVLALNPNVSEALHNRGYAHLLAGRYDAAIADLEETLELNADFAYAHNNLGWAHHMKGDETAALHSIDRSIAMDPNNAYAHYNRGIVLHSLGRTAEACQSWTQALERGFRIGYGNAVDLEMEQHCK